MDNNAHALTHALGTLKFLYYCEITNSVKVKYHKKRSKFVIILYSLKLDVARIRFSV